MSSTCSGLSRACLRDHRRGSDHAPEGAHPRGEPRDRLPGRADGGGVRARPVPGAIPNLLGGLLGRYYFARRFGLHVWRRYSPVLLVGFTCGMGLIAMVAIALGLITKSVSFLPF